MSKAQLRQITLHCYVVSHTKLVKFDLL